MLIISMNVNQTVGLIISQLGGYYVPQLPEG